jgi:hypothetical protein
MHQGHVSLGDQKTVTIFVHNSSSQTRQHREAHKNRYLTTPSPIPTAQKPLPTDIHDQRNAARVSRNVPPRAPPTATDPLDVALRSSESHLRKKRTKNVTCPCGPAHKPLPSDLAKPKQFHGKRPTLRLRTPQHFARRLRLVGLLYKSKTSQTYKRSSLTLFVSTT